MIKNKIKESKFIYGSLKGIRSFVSKVFRPRKVYLLLNSKKPLSNYYGLDRGTPVDRYYIENFLDNNSGLIRGKCLELLNNKYTVRFGGGSVTKSEILDIDQSNKQATIYGDLRKLENIGDNEFDCIILTQVLQFIDDLDSAIQEIYRILKPGGILLATMPSISRVDCVSGTGEDFWRFTKASAMYLFTKKFKPKNVEIESVGNVLTAVNFLSGVSREEMLADQLDYNDENFPNLITVKAIK
jgi:SAM-dependent methyltransferase